jgi:hypothetical protein
VPLHGAPRHRRSPATNPGHLFIDKRSKLEVVYPFILFKSKSQIHGSMTQGDPMHCEPVNRYCGHGPLCSGPIPCLFPLENNSKIPFIHSILQKSPQPLIYLEPNLLRRKIIL